ncbi:MAG: hypothetical protein LBC77_08690 [Spirochaetaceae bacterium]|jgi:hypothetical protein|nr:hypothetical protein [Spirochaetaceae bacterium]
MKKMTLPSVLFLVFSWFVSAAETDGVSVSIRYYDKKVYFNEGEPVQILVTIANNSPEVYRFRIADDRAFSVDFDTRTRANRALEQADALERKRSGAGRIFFRDVSIEPGESFSFVENLRDWSKITNAGSFIVQARVYPELIKSSVPPLSSNRLTLQIKGQAIKGEDGLAVALDMETGAVLQREKLPPDEVVGWTLRARQKSEWEKFFLYLDLEKMLSRDGSRQRRWRAESEEGRQRMIANYRTELQKSTIDGDLSSIPMTFDIERTVYGGNEGTVIVMEKFKTGDYIERKRFTYYLEKIDEYWTIVDYTVMNLGTE